MGLHQIKVSTHQKTITGIKKLPTELEKILVSSSTDKGSISRIYQELRKLNSKNPK
jgi:hypothetical protein